MTSPQLTSDSITGKLKAFSLRLGTNWGCLLAPIYETVLEIRARPIRQENKLKAFKLEKKNKYFTICRWHKERTLKTPQKMLELINKSESCKIQN